MKDLNKKFEHAADFLSMSGNEIQEHKRSCYSELWNLNLPESQINEVKGIVIEMAILKQRLLTASTVEYSHSHKAMLLMDFDLGKVIANPECTSILDLKTCQVLRPEDHQPTE